MYLKAAGGNWSAAGTWSTTGSGGVDNSGPPDATTDVIMEAGSGAVTIDGTSGSPSLARSIDCTTGTGNYANTITAGATAQINLGDATQGANNVAVKIRAGTFAPDAASLFNFISTSNIQQTVDFGGFTMGNITFNSASNGNYAMTAAITNATGSTVTLTKGTLHTDGAADNSAFAHSWGKFSWAAGNVETLTLGNSSITLKVTGNALSSVASTNATITANTATMTFTGVSATPNFQNKDWNGLSVVYSGGGSMSINSGGTQGWTLGNLTVNGTNVKTDSFSLGGSFTVTGAVAFNGEGTTGDRVLVLSSTIGTARTLTLSGASASITGQYVDFRDFTVTSSGGAPATPINLASITGGSGDAGGNSGMTLTSPLTLYWRTAAGGAWATAANWDTNPSATSRVPLPQDTASFNVANGAINLNSAVTIQQNMPRTGSINFTGMTFTNPTKPVFTMNSNDQTIYGSLTFISNMTLTMGSSRAITFAGRSSSTLTSAGLSLGGGGGGTSSVSITVFGSTLTLQDAMNTSTGTLTLTNGTFNDNNFDVTVNTFNSSGSSTRTLTMGTTNTWSLVGTGTIWNVVASLTLNAHTSTISMTDVSTSAKTFAGGGKTYGNISITSDSTAGTTTFTGANTFATFPQVTGGTKSLVFPASTITTIINGRNGFGNGTNLVTITSSTSSTAATFSTPGGVVSCDYLDLTDSTASGTVPFYAGTHSNNTARNTNWTFTAPPFHTDSITGSSLITGGSLLN